MTQPYRHLLTSSDDLHVSRTLACALGLNTSIFVRRVQEWLEYNEKHKAKQEETHWRDGRWWSWNTYAKWVDDIKVFSMSTMRRAIGHGEALGIILSTDAYNKHKNDSTKWYSIDYEAFDDFMQIWDKNGQPNGNRLDKDYNELLSQWSQFRAIKAIVGLFKMSSPAVQDEQPTLPVPAVQDEQSITSRVFSVESAGESRPRGIGVEKAKLILSTPTHMRRFELQNMTSHPLIDAYSEAIGATHIASEKDKIAALEAEIAGYVPEDVKALVASKRRGADNGKPFKYLFSWMVNDLAAFKAEQVTPETAYTTMSPAVPPPPDHKRATPEEAEAIFRAAAEMRGRPYAPPKLKQEAANVRPTT